MLNDNGMLLELPQSFQPLDDREGRLSAAPRAPLPFTTAEADEEDAAEAEFEKARRMMKGERSPAAAATTLWLHMMRALQASSMLFHSNIPEEVRSFLVKRLTTLKQGKGMREWSPEHVITKKQTPMGPEKTNQPN